VSDDLHFRYRAYTDVLAYGQAKTANVLFGVAATKRWASDGITLTPLCPAPR
jgi:NAD(P)-dependent dehydrogenase (short-subunit alcohol dehydrogenase family)